MEIIYGTQYYRYPTPEPDQWERDIANIKKAGFNTIRFWAMWRSNSPAKGVYDFSDIQTMMDLAEKYELKAVINIIMDIMPTWTLREYPDSLMEMANGQKIYPQAPAHRMLGGAPGPCYHHRELAEERMSFIRALVKQFADHKALYLWDVWSEPELTNAIARNADKEHLTCYCQHSERAFKEWLQKKYGPIKNLNKAWKRPYQNYEEVELPRHSDSYKDMIDWRTFFADTLAEEMKRRTEAVRSEDTVHPVMAHTVPLPYFNMIDACCDEYKMAKHCDIFGNSIGSEPYMATMTASAAKGKKVINAELHLLGGTTFSRTAIRTYNDFKKQMYIPLGKGIKGFIYWQYRPELCNREGPCWGLTSLSGEQAKYLDYASQVHGSMEAYADILDGAEPKPAKVAVIRDHNNEIFTWCADRSVDKYFKSLRGAFQIFHDLSVEADIITTQQLLEQGCDAYKVIYYPLPYYMQEEVGKKLRQFVEAGGTLISEAFFGAYRDEVNLFSEKIPGYGFDEVFGAHEGDVVAASSFGSAYGDEWIKEQKDQNVFDIYGTQAEEPQDMKGYFFIEELIPTSGETKARVYTKHGDYSVLVENRYGAGKAVICGTLLGAAYQETRSDGIREMIEGLLRESGITAQVETSLPKVHTDLLEDEKGYALVIHSNRDSEKSEKIWLHLPEEMNVTCFTDIDTKERFAVSGGFLAGLRMKKDEIRVLVAYKTSDEV